MINIVRKCISLITSISKRIYESNVLEKESYVVIVFYLLHVWINTNRYYLVLISFYLLILFLLSHNVKKTFWIALVSSFPFQQGKYFVGMFTSFTFPEAQSLIIYFIAFSDVLLMCLLWVTIRDKNTALVSQKLALPDFLLLPIVIVAGISTYYANFFFMALFGFYQMIKMFLMYLLARVLLKDRAWIKLTLEIFILFVLFNSGLILLQTIRGGPLGIAVESHNIWSLYGRHAFETPSLYRPAGFTVDPNASATILGMFLPLLLVFGITKNFLHKGLVWVTLLGAGLALIYTSSRSVWAATAILILPAIYYSRTLYQIDIPAFIRKYGILILVIIISVAVPLVLFRLKTLSVALGDSGSGTYRIRHIQIALNSLHSYPLGTGLNTAAYEMSVKYDPSVYMNDPSELHNIIAQIATGIGLPGVFFFVLFYTVLLITFAKSIKKHHNNTVLSLAILLALICFLMSSSFYPWFLVVPISGFFWILAACIV